jgi:hypothetical protein
MNPLLLEACIAWLRAQATIVSAFGEDLTASPPTIKLWSDYAGPTVPALPYLILLVPQGRYQYETIDDDHYASRTSDGVMLCRVFAASDADARALAVLVSDPPYGLMDAGLTFSGGIDLIYLRPTDDAFPVITEVGPDGSPTAFTMQVAFRFLTEQNQLEHIT